jgi:hypothetical protein
MPEPVTISGVHVPGDDHIEIRFDPRYPQEVLIMYYEGFPVSVMYGDGEYTFYGGGRDDWAEFEKTIESEPSITKRQVQLRVQKIVKEFKTWVDENLHEDEVARNRGDEIAEMFRAYALAGDPVKKKDENQKVLISDEPEISRKNALILELVGDSG